MNELSPSGVADPRTQVSRLGFIGFQTEDVDRMAEYYVEALGFTAVERSADAAFLTLGPDHHCVGITKGSAEARTHLGLQISGELVDAERRLRAAGQKVERQSDVQPGVPSVLTIAEPDGSPLYLFEAIEGSGAESLLGPSPSKLGHVASFVSDLAHTQNFYEEMLGFRWSDMIGDYFTFLRCGSEHHTVNFLSQPSMTGMHHVAFEARDVNHLKDLLDRLAKHGYTLDWGLGRHGAGHNLYTYHRDPDGNTIELFTELDLIMDERTGQFEPRPWHEAFPQYPRVWEANRATANMWGPLAPGMNAEG